MKSYATEAELHAALALTHYVERNLLLTKIERLTALLTEHGIPLPQDDPALGVSDGAHLEACRVVVARAYDLLESSRLFDEALTELRRLVGSGMELVGGERWRP